MKVQIFPRDGFNIEIQKWSHGGNGRLILIYLDFLLQYDGSQSSSSWLKMFHSANLIFLVLNLINARYICSVYPHWMDTTNVQIIKRKNFSSLGFIFVDTIYQDCFRCHYLFLFPELKLLYFPITQTKYPLELLSEATEQKSG